MSVEQLEHHDVRIYSFEDPLVDGEGEEVKITETGRLMNDLALCDFIIQNAKDPEVNFAASKDYLEKIEDKRMDLLVALQFPDDEIESREIIERSKIELESYGFTFNREYSSSPPVKE